MALGILQIGCVRLPDCSDCGRAHCVSDGCTPDVSNNLRRKRGRLTICVLCVDEDLVHVLP